MLQLASKLRCLLDLASSSKLSWGGSTAQGAQQQWRVLSAIYMGLALCGSSLGLLGGVGDCLWPAEREQLLCGPSQQGLAWAAAWLRSVAKFSATPLFFFSFCFPAVVVLRKKRKHSSAEEKIQHMPLRLHPSVPISLPVIQPERAGSLPRPVLVLPAPILLVLVCWL